MKTIGLLTFHFPVNYGAVLQTFGLFSFLTHRGYDTEIINYFSDEHMRRYDFYQKPASLKMLVYNIMMTLFIKDYLLRRKHFHQFTSQHYKVTQRYKEIHSISFDYDCVLTGSDQVFNFEHPESIVYFQPFEKKITQKKVAYAPSFGSTQFSDQLKAKIEKYVRDFDALSCREDNGAAFLSEMVGHAVPQVLDPVFLLDQDDWSKHCSKRLIREDYLFIYDLNGKRPLIDIAKTLNKGKYKIVMVSNDPLARMKKEYMGVDIFMNSAGPEEFLSLIRFSSAVVTDSFHGTAFSLIFKRPFYTYIALEKSAVRITSLLNRLSLQDRVIFKGTPLTSIKGMDEKPEIAGLTEMIEKSKSYLIHALNE